MRPAKSILDKAFKYTPSTHTSVSETWKRHGWKPKESAPQRVLGQTTALADEPRNPYRGAAAAPRVIPIKEIK